MKCLLFLALIALATAKVINRNDCEGIIVDNISHEKVVLKEYLDKPYQLSMDYNNNVLYFSYTKGGPDPFALAYINLKTNEFGSITGVSGGFASAVDDKTHSVYFGGRNGIYKLDPETKRATNQDVTSKDIWQMFSKDGIYFTTYPEEQAYIYKNDQVSKVTEIGNTRALLIGVDNNSNILFSNSSGLFYYTKNDGKTAHIADHTLNGITTDSNGKIFFSTPTGMFSFNDQTKEVKRLATVINMYGMAVESDGSFLYASDNSIIRLKSTGKECLTNIEDKNDN